MGFEVNKKLMTDLFLMIYRQQPVDTVIKDFTRDVIADYLKTDHCTNALSYIVVHNALKDQVHVLPGLYDLMTDYLRTDHKNLVHLLAPTLIDVGWSDMVRDVMFQTLLQTGHDTL